MRSQFDGNFIYRKRKTDKQKHEVKTGKQIEKNRKRVKFFERGKERESVCVRESRGLRIRVFEYTDRQMYRQSPIFSLVTKNTF